jgi:hypothetical protein
MLTGEDQEVLIIRCVPDHSGWQDGSFDLEDLEEVLCDFARDHFGTND